MDTATLIARESFVERGARERVAGLLDAGTMRELLDPFERLRSPWLAEQDIVTQADDGVVIARGTIAGTAVVCCAVEPAFQGGAIGEVGGAKIAGALELALEDAEAGRPVVPVLLLETGGVRLQEANCGLAAIAEIHAAIAALRAHVPVVGVVAGPVGCFGGMSIAAGLCSQLIATREARLGLNGPQVIEQEAGVDEFDSRDRPMIWSLTGGEQRGPPAWWTRSAPTRRRSPPKSRLRPAGPEDPPRRGRRRRAGPPGANRRQARRGGWVRDAFQTPTDDGSDYDRDDPSSRGGRWLAALTDEGPRCPAIPTACAWSTANSTAPRRAISRSPIRPATSSPAAAKWAWSRAGAGARRT